MARITRSGRAALRSEAMRFLAQHGFLRPPLPPSQALAARNIEVAQLSLDDLLVKVNLPAEDRQGIQAMLDTQAREVVFRIGLPEQKRSWGSLHEIGHEFIQWQRELLYCCPLLLLPARIQDQFEAEADIFAAEAFFFGDKFNKLAQEGDLSLVTAQQLAETVYETSLHATFVHYVRESEFPCCLLVWRPANNNGSPGTSDELVLHYYVKSSSFTGHIDTGQIADADDVIAKIFKDPKLGGVIRHEITLASKTGKAFSVDAESFSNSYNVFTLIRQPQRLSAAA